MSFITNFNFKAFATDLRARETLQNKNGFSLSLLSSVEMERMSAVDVACRLHDKDANRGTPWAPKTLKKYPGMQWATFWDTRMGNFDQRTFQTQRCTTCQSDNVSKFGNERCIGHFGTIRMPRMFPAEGLAKDKERVVVYNPHLFNELEVLLQAECFCCHRFRAPDLDVHRYLWALLIVDFGLIGEALHLLDVVGNTKGQDQKGKRLRDPNERIINDPTTLEQHARAVLTRHGITEQDIRDALVSRRGPKLTKTLAAQDVRNQIVKEALAALKEVPNDCSHCHAFSPRVTVKDSQFFFHFGKKAFTDANVEAGLMTLGDVTAWERENKRHNRTRTYYRSNLAQQHIQLLCTQEAVILSLLFPFLGEASIPLKRVDRLPPDQWHTVFYLDRLLVPPLPLRLNSGVQVQDSGALSPDSKTKLLDNALGFVEQIESYYNIVNCGGAGGRPTDAQEIANEINLRNLQLTVNESYTTVLESFAKKEGLFRMHMMGKRVNQACRSVISPDYLVEPNEVLLPRPFARSLSFPEQIVFYAPSRTAFLKQCIINGANKYPGATHIEHRLANGEIRIIELTRADDLTRRQTAERIFAQAAQQKDTFVVYRHVVDGDRAVFNRQPTLHKPSMMGYRIKVLSGLKTIRFHYVNGKSYNADFDGDEMNIHVPQSIEAKAELECLMDANLNFLVPTSGKPIRGLIQDHVAAGVLLTVRDKFIDRPRFVQLLYFALFPYLAAATAGGTATTFSDMVPMPTILKPRPLWTGKQLISVIVRFVSSVYAKKQNGPSLKGTSLIQPSAYTHTDLKTLKIVTVKKDDMGDDRVIFQDGELLCGAVCKNQLGPSSMSIAHVINELYGAHAVGDLFGALGRVLTQSLQLEGFSMGVDDMALTQEKRRTDLLRQLDEATLDLPDDEGIAMGKIMELSTALQKEYVPGRMLVPFPTNQLVMMTVSGAKGSNTNTIQMALGLGQQLFDGQRVKRMNSGKTLPGFFIGEKRARSFGYAMGRFASGIRPPEYTIHAMAGRDGLIDTAVKTSRSGHLQRCLIKGLESLTVSWDRSVRDSNGSVIQFVYGGDGLDPCKASTLTSWEFVKDNIDDLQARYHCLNARLGGIITNNSNDDGSGGAASPAVNANGKRPAAVHDADITNNVAANEEAVLRNAIHTEATRNALPAAMQQSLHKFMDTKASIRGFTRVSQIARWGKTGSVAEKLADRKHEYSEYFKEVCEEITSKRRIRAYSEAGEPVGLLAAQAAGEPSTQMTLNTFHSAGATVTHVTEGIPRLRELLIHASVQKAAVVIPVEKAGQHDEAALARIIKAAVPIRMTDCLAPMPSNRNTKIAVHRTEISTEIDIALLFSKQLLESAASSMCMGHQEHVSSFTTALKGFVKTMVNVLRGRAPAGGRGDAEKEGVTASGVEDPSMIQRNDEDKDSGDDDDAPSDEDEAERVTQAGDAVSPALDAAAANAADDDAMSDVDALADEASADGYDEKEEEVAPNRGGPKNSKGHYTTFAAVTCAYGSQRFRAVIQPVPRTQYQSLDALPADFFVVKIRLTCPSNVVAVIPDVVQGALTTVTFPTWLPQFEKCHFARNAEDITSGDLWFQGKGATVKGAVSITSMFSLNAPAIKIRKARSTDINDMAAACGIESAYRSLFEELNKLFKRYAVDPRHMSLVADAATHRGFWENYNFTGVISRSASPLFQMTFASSKKFLHTAVTRGIGDGLDSISSAIMVGERPKVGTATVKWANDTALMQDVFERTHSAAAGMLRSSSNLKV